MQENASLWDQLKILGGALPLPIPLGAWRTRVHCPTHFLVPSGAYVDGSVTLCACQTVGFQSKYFLDNSLASGKRLQCGPVLRYKDALKVNLKQCGVDPSALGDDTQDRSAWRTLCHEAVTKFEDSRVEALAHKRAVRKGAQPRSNLSAWPCDSCPHVCSSKIGLHDQGRINYLVGPTHSTTPGSQWKARRRIGREGGGGCVPPQPNRVLGSVVYAPQREEYIIDDRDFGNF